MENIVQIQYIISALIGFGSAVIVAIIAGMFQLRIAKKNREIQEKQLEESRKQFFMKMEQSQKNMLKNRAITRRTEKSKFGKS